MKLIVVSHKPCWPSTISPSGYATDGGFPFQMRALSELFDATTLLVPISHQANREGEVVLDGRNLSVKPLTTPSGRDFWRKVGFPIWLLRNLLILMPEILHADAVHAPVPGDVGTIGMLLAFLLRKRLFVRYCGNWAVQRTAAERFWRWFMEKVAGGRNVMLATGGDTAPASLKNSSIKWIFATSLTEQELSACGGSKELSFQQPVRLIIACRQDRGKGTGILIESLPIILREFPSTSLDIVGDGESLNEFRKMVATLNLNKSVSFHGKVDHSTIMQLLRRADLFCYPTQSEGFPKAVLEALACGLPVVTSSVSVLPQLINKGGGVLLDECSPSAVANAVRRILADPKSYRSMSAKAIETARQYSLENWRDEIGRTLQDAWREPLIAA
jgi:glycosyltransferase involved in cell wall biosynthesis